MVRIFSTFEFVKSGQLCETIFVSEGNRQSAADNNDLNANVKVGTQNEVKNEPNKEPNEEEVVRQKDASVPNVQPVRQRRNSLPFPFNVRGRRPSTECQLMKPIEEEKDVNDDKEQDKENDK